MFDKETMEEAVKAKREVTEGNLTIWNVRLEALVRIGDIRGILDHLISPVDEVTDNCKCNLNCGYGGCGGAEIVPGEIVQTPPGADIKTKG